MEEIKSWVSDWMDCWVRSEWVNKVLSKWNNKWANEILKEWMWVNVSMSKQVNKWVSEYESVGEYMVSKNGRELDNDEGIQ